MRRIRGKKVKGGKKNKRRKALRRIRGFRNPHLYEVDEKGCIRKIKSIGGN